MKFIDKLKDLFTDEEEVVETKEIELEKEEKEEEHKLPTFMRNKIEQEEKREEIRKQREESPKEDVISDREIVKTRSSNFSFPMDMDDDPIPRTFVNTTSSNYNTAYNNNKNVLDKEKKVSELYAKKEEPKPKKFKPTPVISPVYGVLDKNYTKDEVKVQDEDSYEIKRPSRKVDFETVRNKAFGSLTDDIRNNLCENCELYKEVKITKNADKKLLSDDDNLLSDMTKDDVKDVTLEEAEDNYFDFGVDYEIPKKEEKPSVVINAKEVEANDTDVKIVNHNGTESTAEKIEVKEEPPKRTTRVTVKKELEDTKEFEKVSPEEKTIDEALNGGKIRINLPIPSSVKDTHAKVKHISNGNVIDEKEYEINKTEDGKKYITIETTSFSTFEISYFTAKNLNPQTGDNVMTYVIMLLGSVLTIGTIAVLKKRFN